MARRDAAGWRLAEQAVPDSDLLIGTLSAVAVGAAGEVCGAWVNQPPRLGQTPADTGSMTNEGLWFSCWTLPQPSAATDAGADTGEPERGGEPESPVRVNDETSGVRQSTPVLILDRRGNAFAVWNGARDGVPGIFAANRPVGQPWEPAARIANGVDPWALWSPAVALDDEGNLHAIWADTQEGASGIYAAARTADSGWGSIVRLSDLGTGNRINPTIAVDGQGNVYAAWQRFYGMGVGRSPSPVTSSSAASPRAPAGSVPFGLAPTSAAATPRRRSSPWAATARPTWCGKSRSPTATCFSHPSGPQTANGNPRRPFPTPLAIGRRLARRSR